MSNKSSGQLDVQSMLVTHLITVGLWELGPAVLNALSVETLGVGRPPWADHGFTCRGHGQWLFVVADVSTKGPLPTSVIPPGGKR